MWGSVGPHGWALRGRTQIAAEVKEKITSAMGWRSKLTPRAVPRGVRRGISCDLPFSLLRSGEQQQLSRFASSYLFVDTCVDSWSKCRTTWNNPHGADGSRKREAKKMSIGCMPMDKKTGT